MLENYHMIQSQYLIDSFESLISGYPRYFDDFELEDIANSRLIESRLSKAF